MSSEGLELALQDMLVGKCFVGPLCLEPFEVPNSLNPKIVDICRKCSYTQPCIEVQRICGPQAKKKLLLYHQRKNCR